MDLDTVRTHVEDLIGQDGTVAQDSVTDARLNRWINRAAIHLAELIKQHSPEEWTTTGTISVVSGTREYSLLTMSATFQDLQLVEETISGSDRPIPVVVDRVWTRGNRAIPNRLYLRGDNLGYYVVPTSSRTLTVHYAPSVTATDGDTFDWSLLAKQNPRIRDPFHTAMIYWVAYHMLAAENSDHTMWKQESREAELDIVNTLMKRRKGPRFINVIPKRQLGRVVRYG